MASNKPGKCCTEGVKHEGIAQGEFKTVGGVRSYVIYPEDKSTGKAILIMTDVLGVDSINVQLIADQFAANGYFTVIPDMFNGNPYPQNPAPGVDIWSWMKSDMPNTDKLDPLLDEVLKEMRGSYECKKVGSVGYCFGGKYVVRTLKPGKIDAGYTAHPSFVEREELEGILGPLSISAAETDFIFSTEKRHETEDILLKLESPYQINLYSDVKHGFAVRSDLANPREKFAKEQAFFQAVHWFDHFLK
ncbi:alpha/beta-hydrolase [Amniculicola lignicola CBS 123094]|uniref:Alpha/beta-hydrolase n=1 Tax=Amniculicola lignicola CBS 123094 TaxID=1392246 RepID=A0A6A5WKE7_9PLEO|nr:alpha/beta-hydrolase [Amniculicola lignicola CBS 123094]